MKVELLKVEAVGVIVKLPQLVDRARAAQDWRGVGLVEVVVVSGIDQAMDMDAEIVRQVLPDVSQVMFDLRDMLADSLGRGVGGRRRHHNRLLNLLDLSGVLNGFRTQVANLTRQFIHRASGWGGRHGRRRISTHHVVMARSFGFHGRARILSPGQAGLGDDHKCHDQTECHGKSDRLVPRHYFLLQARLAP